MDPSKSLHKFGKLIGYFEKASGPSQTQVDIILGGQINSLSPAHPVTRSPCSLSLLPGSLWLCGPAAGCMGSKRLSFRMKQKFWTLTFVLALLTTQLDFSVARQTEKKPTLETQGTTSISTQINHLATPQTTVSSVWVLGMFSSRSRGRV